MGAHLAGRVLPEVAQRVSSLADSARALKLPASSLIDKTLEGVAKGAPPDRIVTAARTLFGQLSLAATAIREAGVAPDGDAVEAGTFALGAGLSDSNVVDIVRAADPNHPVALVLQVAGALAAQGVLPSETVGLVRAAIHSGQSLSDMTEISDQAVVATGKGVPPGAAAMGMTRVVQARSQQHGQGGNTPHKP